jgi:hypothetical protein
VKPVKLPFVVVALELSLASLGAPSRGLAQNASMPTFRILEAGPETQVHFSIAQDMRPKPAFESSPALVEGAQGLFFVTTGWSWLCRADGGLFSKEIVIDKARCQRFSTPMRIDRATGRNLEPSEVDMTTGDWRRSYGGVFAAAGLPTPWRGYSYLAIVHGENKNERIGQHLYANTVNSQTPPEACASGYQGGQYADCFQAYYAFVSLQLWGNIGTNGQTVEPVFDAGPILWPCMGYKIGDQKGSDGLRHPSAITADGYLYIYYLDTSRGKEEGRSGGLHLARMKLPSAGTTKLPPALPYFNGAFSPDNPSLPSGFDKEKIRDFYDQPGGRASELWSKSSGTVRFSVARIKGTSYLLGVEEYVGREALEKPWRIQIRISADFVHWSDPVPVPGTEVDGGWGVGTMHYPIFADGSGSHTNVIDPEDFYIVAAQKGGSIVSRHVSIQLNPKRDRK